MNTIPSPERRRLLLGLLALPAAGCAIHPLQALDTRPSQAPAGPTPVRQPVLGQAWTYRKLNAFNGEVVDTETATVAEMGSTIRVTRRNAQGQPLPEEWHARWGDLLVDPAWDMTQRYETPLRLWPDALEPGLTLVQNDHYTLPGGSFRYWIQAQSSTQGWEAVTIGGRTFQCLRVERMIRLQHPDVSRLATVRNDTLWVAPEVGRWVAREISGRYALPERRPWTGLEDHFRWELQA